MKPDIEFYKQLLCAATAGVVANRKLVGNIDMVNYQESLRDLSAGIASLACQVFEDFVEYAPDALFPDEEVDDA